MRQPDINRLNRALEHLKAATTHLSSIKWETQPLWSPAYWLKQRVISSIYVEPSKTSRTFKKKTQMKKNSFRKALIVISGALFFPLLCIECWWINLIAIALLGTAALLNPDYVG